MLTAISLLVRTYCGAIWLLAGTGKLSDSLDKGWPRQFRFARLLPPRVTMWTLALSEIALGLCLMAGVGFPATPAISAIAFAGFLCLRVIHKTEADCGCFGRLKRKGAVRKSQLAVWSALSMLLIGSSKNYSLHVSPIIVIAFASVVTLVIAVGAAYKRKKQIALIPTDTLLPLPLPYTDDGVPMG